jgi:hypothetical protein
MAAKRKRRLYSLFSVSEVKGRKRYMRLSDLAMPKDKAVVFWQNALLSLGLGGQMRELRPVSSPSLVKAWAERLEPVKDV